MQGLSHKVYGSALFGGEERRALAARVQAAAVAAHRCLGLAGYSRTDFRLREDGEIFALETNTLPGMTSASLIPKEAAAEGMSFIELLETLLGYAIRLHKKA